jgi:transposase InsO family protein
MEIALLCEIAKVSASGYYRWRKHFGEQKKDHEDYLLVKAAFDKGKGKYGARTVEMKLREAKTPMNLKKVRRIMREYGLITKIRRVNPYKMIMKKTMEHTTAPNILDRKFDQKEPYKILGTDISYLPYHHRFAYLSVVKDMVTGEVLSWELSQHLEMGIVMNTMEKLKRVDGKDFEGVLLHSDQGFHYTNPLYIEKLKGLKIIQSMSRKGKCIDNAPTESFFGHMKDDIDLKACKTYEEVSLIISEYMRYYNDERQQWDRKKMTPVEYRNHLLKSDG